MLFGCDTFVSTQTSCTAGLTDEDFVYKGVTYRVNRLFVSSNTGRLTLEVDPDAGSNLAGMTLHLGTAQLTVGEDVRVSFGRALSWANSGVTWSDNQQVAVRLVAPPPSLGRAGSMSVDGFHPMGPGRMKIAEGTSITYGIVIHQPPTADLTITPRHHNVRPDGSDYPNVDTSLLTIHNAVTWKAAPHPNYLSGDWQQAKSVGLTAVDDNECKSPPGTRYWIRHHGSGGGPDWGGWDRQDRHHGLVISIEIIDDDCKYLAASPGQVYPEEGASATYTVRLKEPLEDAAYISPRISVPGDSDPGAITVSPERIRVEAGDTSPKTFTVSAGRDANSRNEVLIVDHSVDSPEVPADYLGGRVTVIVQDEQNAARTQERDALSVTGLALTAGSEAVALSPAFSPGVTSYRAQVPAGTTSVTLAPHWSGGASVHAGSRRGSTTFTRPARVRPSGTAVDLALAPDGGATELWVMASGGSGGMTTYRIEVTEAQTPLAQTLTTGGDGTPGGGGGSPSGDGGGGGAPPTSPSPEEPQDPEQSDDCGDNDRENLVSFYDATGGDNNWLEKTNWKSSEPLDQWYGVDTEEDGEVVSLRLADNNLSGQMPTKELLCLNEDTELKELALWGNEDLLGDVPDELALTVERAVLRDVAEALELNPEWFDDYEDPFSFEDWHEGVVMTDEDGRVMGLDFTGEDITGEIPGSVFELENLTVIRRGCEVTLEVEAPGRVSVMMADGCEETPDETPDETPTSGDGGCALGQEDSSVSGFGLFLVTIFVFAALVRRRVLVSRLAGNRR